MSTHQDIQIDIHDTILNVENIEDLLYILLNQHNLLHHMVLFHAGQTLVEGSVRGEVQRHARHQAGTGEEYGEQEPERADRRTRHGGEYGS